MSNNSSTAAMETKQPNMMAETESPSVALKAHDNTSSESSAKQTQGDGAKDRQQEASIVPQQQEATRQKKETADSPYERLKHEMMQCIDRYDDDKSMEVCMVSDPLEGLEEERLLELDLVDCDLNALEDEERLVALRQLTESEVKKHVHCMLLPQKVFDLQGKLYQDILFADERNSRGSSIMMLDTYSSWCMYPVLQKQISKANRLLNAALKLQKQQQQHTETSSPVILQGFHQAWATIEAIHAADHWRCDYEDEEENNKIAKRVLALARNLLQLRNVELGIRDPFTRPGMLFHLSEIADDWLGGKDKLFTKKNGHGNGAPQDDDITVVPPAAKKAKVTPTATGHVLLDFVVSDMPAERLQRRVKTAVQLQITDGTDPTHPSVAVVVSGATSVKKLHQLVAYLTGHSPDFQTHSQRGKSVPGARVEVSVNSNGSQTLWLAAKGAAKQAAAQDSGFAVDQDVKVVQLFQGLTTGRHTGMVWDSPLARTVGTNPTAVAWVAPEDANRYWITAQAIIPQKCIGKGLPLPRVVIPEPDISTILYERTAFGRLVAVANEYLRQGRQGPTYVVSASCTEERLAHFLDQDMARPLCDEEGKNCCADQWFGLDRIFTPENVRSAGAPPSYQG